MDELWVEIENDQNVNSFRRNIQSEHIDILISIMLNKNKKFSSDATSLARNNLNKLYKKIEEIPNNNHLDEYTFSHYKDIGNKIFSRFNKDLI